MYTYLHTYYYDNYQIITNNNLKNLPGSLCKYNLLKPSVYNLSNNKFREIQCVIFVLKKILILI